VYASNIMLYTLEKVLHYVMQIITVTSSITVLCFTHTVYINVLKKQLL
jgi:hypothetical protein